MSRFGHIAAVPLTLCLVAGANAADLALDPLPPSIAQWSGFHIGAGAGGAYDFAKASNTSTVGFVDVEIDEFITWAEYPNSARSMGGASAFGTIDAGYDLQIGDGLVLGILGNFDFGKGKWASFDNDVVTANIPESDNDGFIQNKFRFRRKNSWFVGGRFGWTPSNGSRWLWYGLVGYTQAKIQAHAAWANREDGVIINFDLPSFASTFSKNRGGVTVGGGVETLAISDNVSTRLEYRYTDFKSLNWNTGAVIFPENPDCDTCPAYIQQGQTDVSEHSIRAVISWRFGSRLFE